MGQRNSEDAPKTCSRDMAGDGSEPVCRCSPVSRPAQAETQAAPTGGAYWVSNQNTLLHSVGARAQGGKLLNYFPIMNWTISTQWEWTELIWICVPSPWELMLMWRMTGPFLAPLEAMLLLLKAWRVRETLPVSPTAVISSQMIWMTQSSPLTTTTHLGTSALLQPPPPTYQ